MSIVFLASEIDKPSHLWMRRHAEALAGDIDAALDPGISRSVNVGPVKVLSLRGSGGNRLQRVVREALGDPGGGHQPAIQRRLKARLDASSADAVLVQFLTNAVEFDETLLACDKRLYIHCHGWDVTWDLRDANGSGRLLHSPDYIGRVRRLAGRATFIANSHETRRTLEAAGIDAGHIKVHYFGVPISPPAPRPTDRVPLNLLFLGRLVDFKGPDLVIRVFEEVVAQGIDARLVIAGDGPLRATCELMRSRSPARERIAMPGAVDEAEGRRLRDAADIFVAHNCTGPITHQVEAFGVAFLEAMAEGLPVVSGRSGGLVELVEDGQTGVLVEPGDVAAQVNAIVTLARSPAERLRLGKNGWQRAAKLFSAEGEVPRLRSILGLAAKAGA